MLNEAFLNELKARNDIVDVVSRYTNLKGNRITYKGLCPLPNHNEKTPSFVVYEESQSFYCFGCQRGGDVITFIKEVEHLSYMEAVRFLAQRAGMAMPEIGVDDSMGRLKARVLQANKEAARFFHTCLKEPQGQKALEYLRSRKLSNKTIVHFGLGYAPDSWDSLITHLKSKGFTQAEMVTAALAVQRRSKNGIYDKFRNRVMFPIIDLRGNVIGFGGRKIGDDQGPKYINTDETPVFHKSNHLYALNFAKNTKRGELIVCEGYMDVISMHQAGFDNAVAGLGTALTESHVHLLNQYTDCVVLSYDGDEAGQRAAARAISLLQQSQIQIKVLTVPIHMAKDPDEFIQKYGAQRFEKLIEDSMGSVEYEIAKIKARYNLNTSEGNVNFVREACRYIAQLPTPSEREVYAGRVSEICGVSKANLLLEIEQARSKAARAQQKKQLNKMISGVGEYDKLNPEANNNKRAATAEEMLLCAILRLPDQAERIVQQLGEQDFVTPYYAGLFLQMKKVVQQGQECSLAALSEYIDDEGKSRLAKLLAGSMSYRIGTSDVDSAIYTLKEEKKKSYYAKGSATNEELRARIDKLRQEKK